MDPEIRRRAQAIVDDYKRNKRGAISGAVIDFIRETWGGIVNRNYPENRKGVVAYLENKIGEMI
jgi:hypothetical protein